MSRNWSGCEPQIRPPYCESADNTPVHNCEIVSGSDDIVYNKGKLVCSTHTPSENIIWPYALRRVNIKRMHYWAALRPQQCLQNVTFEDYSGANQWRHRAVHETVVLKKSGLLVHLIVIERAIFCAAFLREMLTCPLTTRCSPWSPPSRRCWSTSPGRTSRGPRAGSCRGWRRPSLLRIIYPLNVKFIWKGINMQSFITLSFSKDFLQ